jgi:hypothetical protein
MFVLVTLFLPNGIAGLLTTRRKGGGKQTIMPGALMAMLPGQAGDK